MSLLTKTYLTACLLLSATVAVADDWGRVFFQYDASNGLADNSAQAIKCTKTGRMVITTIGHVNFFDGASFSHVDPVPENDYPLPKYMGHYHLYFDKHHHLWVKDKQKVTCVDLLKELFIVNVDSVIREMGMQRPVEDMFGDMDNYMWFMSGGTLYCPGLAKQIPLRHTSELQDIDVYRKQQLLQFYANGTVSVYDLKSGRHVGDSSPFADGDTLHYHASSVLLPLDSLFYQIRNGDKDAVLLCYDADTRQWRQLMSTPYHLNNMVEHDNRLYIASEYGIWIYDIATGTTRHFEELAMTRGRRLNTDVNTVCFDRQGGLWLGTERRGLLYLRPFRSPFTTYSWDQPEAGRYAMLIEQQPWMVNPLPLPRHVNCRYTDSRGWVWTGLYTGLQVERPVRGNMKRIYTFTRKDGLLNEMVHSVIEDAQHDIWIGTSYGISHLCIHNDSVSRVETYFNVDNVPNESFVNGRAMRMADGTIVMQSLDHIVTFNPGHMHNDSLVGYRLYPKLVRLLVNGREAHAGEEIDGRVVLEKSITRTGEFTVDYNQNSLSLTFSGLNYQRPAQTYYRYRVKGVYDQWTVMSYLKSDGRVDRNGMLHLPLPGLRPGRYVVEVQCSMSPDVWPVEPFQWVINVEEPWWRRTIMYLILGTLVLGLIVANFLLMNRNTKLRLLRLNGEEEILHRVKTFAQRCLQMKDEVLTPYNIKDGGMGEEGALNPELARVLMQVVPYLNEHHDQAVDMQQLSALTGVETTRLYRMLSSDLYNLPQQLQLLLRLQEAAHLLTTTQLPIQEIASRCNFVSPNFFIANFFHHYRQTPADYRSSMAR